MSPSKTDSLNFGERGGSEFPGSYVIMLTKQQNMAILRMGCAPIENIIYMLFFGSSQSVAMIVSGSREGEKG
jgi:hypothetical protein